MAFDHVYTLQKNFNSVYTFPPLNMYSFFLVLHSVIINFWRKYVNECFCLQQQLNHISLPV